MKVNKWLLPALALGLLLGTVGIAQATGLWQVSGREMVSVEQMTTGADVRGWMTLQQVADGTGIPVETLYARLALPTEIPASTALKDIEPLVEGFEVTVVREVVDAELGATSDAGDAAQVEPEANPSALEPTAMPAAPEPTVAVEATPVATVTVEHTPIGDGAGSGDGEDGAPPAVTSALDIKGRHTLQEIVDATGINMDKLLAALNLPPDTDPHTAVRNLVEAGAIEEIDQIRAAVADLQQ